MNFEEWSATVKCSVPLSSNIKEAFRSVWNEAQKHEREACKMILDDLRNNETDALARAMLDLASALIVKRSILAQAPAATSCAAPSVADSETVRQS